MSDFIEDDVVGELGDRIDSYVEVCEALADRSRMMGEVCQECGEEIAARKSSMAEWRSSPTGSATTGSSR